MKPQAEIGRNTGESRLVRSGASSGCQGCRSGIRARGLFLSLIFFVGAAEFTTGGAAKATPQTENPLETTAQPSVKSTAQDWQPQIVVRVHNYSQIEAGVLLEGEQWAADLLRKAGVDTRWLACSAGEGLHGEMECARPQTLLDLSLNLVKSAKSKDFRLVDNAYGFAAPSTDKEFGRDAWVFDDLVKKSASELQLSSAHLLGTVIAHELGHLLLGPNAHSKWGLMCARWSHEVLLAADRGDLNFSNPERAKIRNFVMACHQEQISAQAQQAPEAPSSTANNEIPVAPQSGHLSK